MRPDAVAWQNTSEMAAIDFSPRHLVSRQVVRWIVWIVLVQATWSILTWVCLNSIHSPRPVEGDSFFAQSVNAIAGIFAENDKFHSLRALIAAQISGLVLILCVMLVRVYPPLRKHTQALRELLDAIRRMANGGSPKPLAVGSPSEATYLSLAFNDMASKLAASRRALIDANQMLERRVEERTKELREAMEKVQVMATTDALTGLQNRRSLEHEVRTEFDLARRQQNELVALLIDLDGFKLVNDTLGHKMGDELIRVTADVLRANSREGDICVRLGGDEFLMVMPLGELTQAVQVADRLQKEFQRRAAELLAGAALAKLPSMSIGVSARKLGGAVTLEELLSQADQALYDAKEHGRARTVVFERRATDKAA
jgi:diguanylate cyclase (GGDEF)-like protein